MTFGNLAGVWVLAGLAALAAGLFALHQLRTRYREVTVVTTLFWRALVDEAPARTLRERFRHPWAYALILTICSLIWLGLAEPQLARTEDGTFHVLVLDGSAGMAAGNRFAQAVDQLERHVSRLPADRRTVVWSGAEIRPLLAPGEDDLLLRKRLEGLTPDAAPASVERALRQLSASVPGGPGQRSTSVVVFGDAPVRRPVIDLVPTGMTVKRAAAPVPLNGNAGITALGVSDAASGAWDKVDVFVDLQATGDRAAAPASTLRFELDGHEIPAASIAEATNAGGRGFVIHDLPAAGGLFTVRLAGDDALALDNAASVRLPQKPVVTVAVSASLMRIIGPVIDADRGARISSDRPDVVIRRAGETIGGNAPALEFVPAATQPQAFFFVHPDAFDSSLVFTNAVADIGLRQIDAMSLAQTSGRPIEVSVGTGKQWRFGVWEELLSENYNFTRSRTFPLFVANAVRWLAGTKAWYPYAAAGRALSTSVPGERTRVVSASGRVIDPIGTEFIPARAGELRREAGDTPLAISLLDSAVTTGARTGPTENDALEIANLATAGFAPRTGFITWLLLLALGLLAFEWRQFQAGRVP